MDGNKDVLKQGLIRRIRTGENTYLWRMNWVPRDGLMRPVSCISNLPLESVSKLIDPVLKTWDMQALKLHFTPMNWEQIMSIPLTTRRQQDFWAWHYEKTVVFLVRSAIPDAS
jgi:hypothetical protein